MKKIKVKGKEIIVDDEDYNFILRLKPTIFRREYKIQNRTHSKSWEVILPGAHGVNLYYVKHILLRPKNANMLVEAKNGNNLDLRKSNLQIIPREVSLHHNRKRLNTSSKYKGVSYKKQKNSKKRWQASISRGSNGGRSYIGVYNTENEAGIAYNEKARELYGNLAYQNKIE